MTASEFKQAYMMCNPSKKSIERLATYISIKPVDYDYTYDDIDLCRYGDNARSRTVWLCRCRHAIVTHGDGVWGVARTSKCYTGGNSGRRQDC